MKKRASIGGDLLRRVECYPTGDNNQTYKIQVVNIVDGGVSEPVIEDPNTHVLWTRKKPLDNAVGPVDPVDGDGEATRGLVYSLSEVAGGNKVTKIVEQ